MAGTDREAPTDDETDSDTPTAEDDGPLAGVTATIGSALGRDDRTTDNESAEPSQAELVDGAQVLFIDSAARSKALYEFDLVLITAPQYPEPVVLKNDAPIEIPAGSVLCPASGATMLDYAGKRVVARSYTFVPPSRADEVALDDREGVPEAVVGETIPQRELQNEQFYNLVLNGVEASA